MKRMIKRSPIPAVGKRTPFGVLLIINLYILWYKKRFYNKCWGDTTTVSLPTLFFCKKISIQDSHTLQ